MARLIAVNVGMPQDVPWRGRTTHTGIWKRPVTGPRMVRRLNVEGDGQGDLEGHGGPNRAVLVYQLASYRYWQKHFDRNDFVHGQFGENFTVEGLADDEVCIGDQYRIGAALFEVTQPRVTCYRVGLRLNEPQMPALLVAHGRPGFYFRVLAEGPVEAGDEIIKVRTGPEAMTVREIDELLYKSAHPRAQLERALRIPSLSPGWQDSMRSLLEDAETPGGGNSGLTGMPGQSPPAWPGFRPLGVSTITAESRSVFSLTLQAQDSSPLPPALPGQFVTVRMQPDPDGPPVIRSYSLSGQPGADTYRISVKQEPDGAGSTYLHQHVELHDTLDVAAPRGTFVLQDTAGPVVLVSAGVGVTPVLAMLHHLAATNDPRPVWWIHGARDGTEHPFMQEARSLLDELPAAHCHIAYSKPRDTDVLGVSYHSIGRVSLDLLKSLNVPADGDTYICGPTKFMDALTAALTAAGRAPAHIHTEAFGSTGAINPGIVPTDTPSPHPPTAPPGPPTGFTVTFTRSNLTVPWTTGYGTLLDLAELCDVPVRWSCRSGVCHTCETSLVSGTVDYTLDLIDPPPDTSVLICCAQPGADIVLDL